MAAPADVALGAQCGMRSKQVRRTQGQTLGPEVFTPDSSDPAIPSRIPGVGAVGGARRALAWSCHSAVESGVTLASHSGSPVVTTSSRVVAKGLLLRQRTRVPGSLRGDRSVLKENDHEGVHGRPVGNDCRARVG